MCKQCRLWLFWSTLTSGSQCGCFRGASPAPGGLKHLSASGKFFTAERLSHQNAALDRSVVWLANILSLGPCWDQLQNKFLVAQVGRHLGEGSCSVWSSLMCGLGGSVPWPKPSLEPLSPCLYNWLNRLSFVLGHLHLDRPKPCLWSGSTSVLCAALRGTSITAPLVAWKLPSVLIAWGTGTVSCKEPQHHSPRGCNRRLVCPRQQARLAS